jgi:hypothetical protein
VYDTNPEIPSYVTSYNIRQASTDIEKASIKWKLNTDIPATLNVIAVWEAIIRRPHLNMIGIQSENPTFMPDYKSYNLSIDYVNLIPINSDLISEFQSADYDALTDDLEFGDLFLSEFDRYLGIEWQHSLSHAYRTNDITNLQTNSTTPIALPRFHSDFQLRQYSFRPESGSSARFNKWAEDNREELTAKGYTPGTATCKVGSLVIGKLIGDPWEEYQKLQNYSRICRTSIIKVE